MPALRSVESRRRRGTTGSGILIAVHRGHLEVHKALEELKGARLDLGQVSVVGTDFHTEENVYGYYSTGRRLEAWGSLGAFWSDVWSILSGAGVFFIPSLGPVVMAGPVVGWLAATLEKGVMVSGLSVLGATLAGKGVPPERMLECEKDIRRNEFLLISSGGLAELAQARSLVESTGARVSVHSL